MPPAQTKEVIEREFEAPLEDVFEWIDLEKPLGSASISQVTFLLLPICHSYASEVTLAVIHSARLHCTYDHSISGSGQVMQKAFLNRLTKQRQFEVLSRNLFHGLFALNRYCCKTQCLLVDEGLALSVDKLLQVHKAKLRKKRFSRRQRKQAAACTQHIVAPGDDVGSIARANNVLVSDIERLNTGTSCT